MRLGLPLGVRRPARAEAAAYADAQLPHARTPWREADWCAVDLELTGLDARLHEIISFGAIPIDAGRVRLGGGVSALVQPAGEISAATIPIHGIRAADLEQAPALSEVIGGLLQAMTGRILVAHTAAVERAFLGRALRAERVRIRGPIVDTQLLGCLWLHARDGVVRTRMALGELAAELGLPADQPHDALGDALTTAQVFVALAAHLDATHPETVGTLSGAKRRVESLRIFHAG
jgi:DNA polymerase-3 subunit epsilon